MNDELLGQIVKFSGSLRGFIWRITGTHMLNLIPDNLPAGFDSAEAFYIVPAWWGYGVV